MDLGLKKQDHISSYFKLSKQDKKYFRSDEPTLIKLPHFEASRIAHHAEAGLCQPREASDSDGAERHSGDACEPPADRLRHRLFGDGGGGIGNTSTLDNCADQILKKNK